MALYFCKAPSTVLSVHNDDQITSVIVADPVKSYGPGTYLIVDIGGPAPASQMLTMPNGDEVPMGFLYPTVTAAMQAQSTKQECKRRILVHISEQAQRNLTAHISDLQTKLIATPPLSPAEQSDLDTAAAIWAWIGRPNGMQAASDAMIAANDLEWYQDVKWPPWNSAWDAFVARF